MTYQVSYFGTWRDDAGEAIHSSRHTMRLRRFMPWPHERIYRRARRMIQRFGQDLHLLSSQQLTQSTASRLFYEGFEVGQIFRQRHSSELSNGKRDRKCTRS